MEAMFLAGAKHSAIGTAFGVSWQRVGQILGARGLSRTDGGTALLRRRALVETARRKAAAHLSAYGCTAEQMVQARSLAKSCGLRKTPLALYAVQKGHAKENGIAWALTFWEWWSVWVRSGKLALRGRGQAYMMFRKNNQGPFSSDNVLIGLSILNSSRKKRSDLPLGVKVEGDAFAAVRMLDGVTQYLGSHPSPDAAHRAYASLAPIEPAARHARSSGGSA